MSLVSKYAYVCSYVCVFKYVCMIKVTHYTYTAATPHANTCAGACLLSVNIIYIMYLHSILVTYEGTSNIVHTVV